MLSAHIASFFKLIGAQLEETSHGMRSIQKSSRVMLKLTKRLLQVERLCSLCGLGKMII
jgi:hypothetical protein